MRKICKMKCSKRKAIILTVVGLIFLVSALSAIFLISPFDTEKSEKRVSYTTQCTTKDCFSKSVRFQVLEALKMPPSEECITEDCTYTRTVTKPYLLGPGICTSKECVLQAAKILRWLDFDVDPCENFYNFSCGKFLTSHAVPDGWTSYGVEDLAEEETALRIKNILERPGPQDNSDSLKRAKQLYKSCLNVSHIEQNSIRDLKHLLSGKGIGDWPFLKEEWNDCRLDLEWRMAKLNALGVDSFFTLNTGFNGSDQRAYAYMTIAPPLVKEICDDHEENETIAFENALKTASKHIKLLKKVLTLLKVEINNDTKEDIEDMFLFDYAFCNITKFSRNLTDDVSYSLWNVTLTDLMNISPEMNWGRWRNIIFSELGASFPHDTFSIYVHGVNDSIDDIIELVHNISSKTVANYLTWKFIYHHLGFLGSPFRQLVQTNRGFFKGDLYKFMDSDRWIPRWHQCVRYVEDLMPVSVLKPHLDRILTPELWTEVSHVISKVKRTFKDTFWNNTFLVRDDKAISKSIIDQVNVQLFYPPDKEKSYYDKYYGDMRTFGESFIKNGLKVKHYLMRKLMEGVNSKRNRYNLDFTILLWNPFVMNARSEFKGNQIVISLGGIDSSQLSTKLPRFLSMSVLGARVGQQLTRGFDLKGIKSFPPNRYNLTSWPNYVIKYVERRAQCASDEYFAKSTDDDEKEILLNDYLTKNQGVHLAYQAYMNYIIKDKDEKHLPGLSLTGEKLFFIRYAQSQCKVIAPGSDTDPGTMTNRVLMNLESLSDAFMCPSGSPMNPVKKCQQLWS